MAEREPSERAWIMRKTRLQKKAVMLFQLNAAELYDQEPARPTKSDNFMQLFVGIVAGSEVSASDLNWAWLEAAETLIKINRIIPRPIMEIYLESINLNFGSVIEAVVQDQSIASQAQQFRRNYERSLAVEKAKRDK